MTVSLRHRVGGAIILAIAIVMIGILTLRPGTGAGAAQPLWCLTCIPLGSRAGADLLLNTLLFVPFAFGLWHVGIGGWRAMAVILATTIAIELLQMFVIPGRYASIADIIANTAGGALGLALAPRWPTIVIPPAGTAIKLVVAATLVWLGLVAVSAFGMQPALPADAYTVSWHPAPAATGRSTGKMLSAFINGRALPPGRYASDDTLGRALRGKGARIDLLLIANSRAGERDPRLDIKSADGTRIVSFGQSERDIALQVRLHARNLRLLAPSVRVMNVIATGGDEEGPVSVPMSDTVRVTADVLGERLRLATTVRGVTTHASLRLAPELGWTFLFEYPDRLPRILLALFGVLWIGLPLAPLGYWAARCIEADELSRGDVLLRRRGLAVLVAGLLVALALIPAVFDAAPVAWPVWLGATASFALGWILGRTSRHLTVAVPTPDHGGTPGLSIRSA